MKSRSTGVRSSAWRAAFWIASTTVPALAALGWLAISVIQQDREQSRERTETEAGQLADVAVSALGRTLAEFDQLLSRAAAGSGLQGAIDERASFTLFSPYGVVARAGRKLPFYPAVARGTRVPSEVLDASDRLELGAADWTGAIALLDTLTRPGVSPGLQAEAWLRLARIRRAQRDTQGALAAFGRVGALGDVVVQDLPAGVAGQVGRCLVLAAADRAGRCEESRAFLEDLSKGRWVLSEDQYEYQRRQAEGWLGQPHANGVSIEDGRLIAAAGSVWRRWVSQSAAGRIEVQRDASGSILAISRVIERDLAVLVADVAVLRDAWQRNLPTAFAERHGLSLRQPDGTVVFGETTSDRVATRLAAESQLPWDVSVGLRPLEPQLARTTRYVLVGVAVVGLLALGASYTISRAVQREHKVAQLQADFVAAVSHEFRTPLTAIRQLSELLARNRVATAERRQEFLDTIVHESDRLGALVEDLLDFGRLESGRLTLSVAPVDLRTLLDHVARDVTQRGLTARHTIDIAVPDELPPVEGDQAALSHVFRNLIENAVKYSPDQERVLVTAAASSGEVAVSVHDRGFGIPASEQPLIFQKFVRGAAATAAGIPGTGIGLAVAKLIVEAHGGAIAVRSAAGAGSTFVVSLPVKAV